MTNIRSYNTIPFSPSMAEEALSEYRSVKDRLCALEQQGEIIRLRNGLYVVSPEASQRPLSLELIANRLYGLSYVSFESALSHYQLIPERVFVMRSACMKRAKSYNTPVGRFEYIHLPDTYYPIGIRSQVHNNEFAYLIATPEKALCDTIIATAGLRIQSVRAMEQYLFEDLRLDLETHPIWDREILEFCAQNGRKRNSLQFLLKVLPNE
jgi:hypothetical protein